MKYSSKKYEPILRGAPTDEASNVQLKKTLFSKQQVPGARVQTHLSKFLVKLNVPFHIVSMTSSAKLVTDFTGATK
jgi:hypothetical protein